MFKKLVYFIYDHFIPKPNYIRKLICIGNNGIWYYITIGFRGNHETYSQEPLLMVVIEEELHGEIQYATCYYTFM